MRTETVGWLVVLVVVATGPTAQADVLNMGPGLTSLEVVPVGNPGNAPDPNYKTDKWHQGNGVVPYAYNIGKYEVTAGQYTAFLNSVAKTDTYGLYDVQMDYDPQPLAYGCNIKRSGVSGKYTYSVASDWANRPVNYVSWADAVRFCNWLANGQPTGRQDLTTTEDGSYYLNGVTADKDLLGVTRRQNATWVIPTEDEWYKAACHKNKGATGAGDWFYYPTSSNEQPSNQLTSPDQGNSANYWVYDGSTYGIFTIGPPYYRTEVGAFTNSGSPYGTFDQAGNVWELDETVYAVDSTDIYADVLGGSSWNPVQWLGHAYLSSAHNPSGGDPFSGFRVAEVPEPATIVLLVLGCLAVLRSRAKARQEKALPVS